jgi:TolC family type I secretion outer membrane protein
MINRTVLPLLTFFLLCAWCAWAGGGKHSIPGPSPDPATPWKPPSAESIEKPKAAPKEPVELPQSGEALTIADVVEIALKNNPQTRAAWFTAKAAWNDMKSKESGYYPSADLTVNLTKTKQAIAAGRLAFQQTTWGPSVSLSYLLFDFGKRRGDLESARQEFIASSFSQNAVIQNVILEVEAAYVSYLKTKALLAAAESNVKNAQENLNAAEERHRAGLATIADVLQAKTFLSQAELNRDTLEGQVLSLKGGLAASMGLPATVDIDVVALPEEIPELGIQETVDSLVEQAEQQRPDLAAARARAVEAQKKVKSTRAEGLPSVVLNSTAGRTHYIDPSGSPASNSYTFGVSLQFPIFTSLENHYNILKAKAEAEAARATADQLANQVILDVWMSYYAMKTAKQKIKTSRDLLDSAEESEKVALERYKAGVGRILDLLAAQSALADARAQQISARADWFLALAFLAHDIGALVIPSFTPGKP